MEQVTLSAAHVRPATRDDCRAMWTWRNAPSARPFFFNTAEIAYADHERWFMGKLADPAMRIFVVVDPGGRDVGYVRCDVSDGEGEISIALDETARGKGWGAAGLLDAVARLREARVERLRAYVRKGNAASIRTFERAGFVLQPEPVVVHGMTAHELTWTAPGHGPVVVFRTDAGPRAGLGHLDRCLALALALRGLGVRTRFVVGGDDSAAARARVHGFEALPVEGSADADLAAPDVITGADAIVLDSPYAGPDALARLRGDERLVVAIDDRAGYSFPCQLVVNNNADAAQLPYRSSSGDTEFLLGPRYALLAPEFSDVPTRLPADDGRAHVLISVGGADSLGLLPRLITGVDGLAGVETITAVCGPFVPHVADVEAAAARARHAVRVVTGPSAMAALMCEATIAVSAAGQTLYRLARTGCPTVALEIATNQSGQLATLAEAGIVRRATLGADGSVAEIMTVLAALLADGDARRRMSAAGQALVDGRGATLVASAILARIGRRMVTR